MRFQSYRASTQKTLDLSNGKATGTPSTSPWVLYVTRVPAEGQGERTARSAGEPASISKCMPTRQRCAARLFNGGESVSLVRFSQLLVKVHGRVTCGWSHMWFCWEAEWNPEVSLTQSPAPPLSWPPALIKSRVVGGQSSISRCAILFLQ